MIRRRATRYPKEVREWAKEQDQCAVCWERLAYCWPPASIHHVIRRGRENALWNLVALCGGCHEDYHGTTRPGMPGLELCHILFVKLLIGPWEPDELETLYGKRLPFLRPLPQEYLDLRRTRRIVAY